MLFGHSRATDDVLIDWFDADTGAATPSDLETAGYWGPAMPLDDLYTTLADNPPIRVADSGSRVPNVELKFATDEYDRLSLLETLTGRFNGKLLRVVAPDVQIPYKLGMSVDRDFEDALHICEMTLGTHNTDTLETYAERLGVSDQYERLRANRSERDGSCRTVPADP